ncbi:MAG TPA: hypothetical protein VND62_06600 [Acidimicrobiales bacterium]|nr:hypothetical protein [Acidimicrobiales bacterium]
MAQEELTAGAQDAGDDLVRAPAGRFVRSGREMDDDLGDRIVHYHRHDAARP